MSQPLVIENPAMLAMQEKKNEFAAGNGLPKEPTAPLVYPVSILELCLVEMNGFTVKFCGVCCLNVFTTNAASKILRKINKQVLNGS